MKHVLVTGGAGFIGSHVAAALVSRGCQVTVLDDLSGGFADNVPSSARFVRGSVTDPAVVDRVCTDGAFDYIYHLAASGAEGLSHFVKRFNYTNNVIGSVNLINAAINTRVKGFVFTSDIAVYGSSPELPMTEATAPHPEDSFGIAKYAVELELRVSRAMFGLDYIVFRPHNVYGPRQNITDRHRNVVGTFMNQILRGQPLTIFGDGTQTRAFTYIDDVAPLMAEAIDLDAAWNQVFNIGADRPTTLNDLARAVADAMDSTADIRHAPSRPEVHHAHSSHDKVRLVFGDRQSTPLADGLRETAAWVRSHGPRSRAISPGLEIERNFPDVWRRG